METIETYENNSRIEKCAMVLMNMADTYENLQRAVCCADRINSSASYYNYNDIVVEQLKELARIIRDDVKTKCEEFVMSEEMKNNIAIHLSKNRVIVENINCIVDDEGKKQMLLNLKAIGKRSITSNQVAALLSDVMGVRMISSDNNRIMLNSVFNLYSFDEAKRFEIVTGVARLSKEYDDLSGDCSMYGKIYKDKHLIGLADGMGSGAYANEISHFVLELLSMALEVGYSGKAALDMINFVMSAREPLENTVAMDICIIDDVIGVADFMKLGAVATFIMRNGCAQMIQSETMPIGIMPTNDYDHTIRKLYSNDLIIMVSDGVLEAIDSEYKEETMLGIIESCRSKNPKALADEILDGIASMGERNDDMTVIVTGLYQGA